MDKRVLLIAAAKSFMISAIAKGLTKGGYEVVNCELSVDAIQAMENKPELWVLYLGDLSLDSVKPIKYIDELIDSQQFLLYEVGNTEELEHAAKLLSPIKVTETYLRPIDVQHLVEDLDTAVANGSIDEDQKKKILVVDDEGATLRMIRTWLAAKYRVYMASSGKIALNFLATNSVDLVLLDYMMPVMDGPAVLKKIRETEAIKDLDVMFLTSKSDKESVVAAASLKPAKYLLKTMPKAKLIRSIDEFFYGPQDFV